MSFKRNEGNANMSRSSSSSVSSVGGGAPLCGSLSTFAFDSPKPPGSSSSHKSLNTTFPLQHSPEVVSGRSRAVSDAIFASPEPREHGTKSTGGFQLGDPAEDEDVFVEGEHGSLPYTVTTTTQDGIPCTIVRTIIDPDDDDRAVGGVDAQVHYPGTACVFVANLPEGAKDSRLEAAVTSAFSKFGCVFVKIRRDNRNMPFAFAQYTRDEHAEVALREGRGTIIEGRPCRTEKVRGNRLFIICRRDNCPITADEAAKELGRTGPIIKTEYISQDVLDALKIDNGVLVEFQNFDPDRDVVALYRRHPTFRVIPYDVKRHDIATRIDADRRYLENYDLERRSVFIGRLPTDIAPADLEKEIRSVMAEAGEVKAVTVISKPPNPERNTAVAFAFCEFAAPHMAINAIESMNGVLIYDTKVKVEAKSSREVAMQNSNRQSFLPRQEASPARPLRSYRSLQSMQPATPPALNRKLSNMSMTPAEAIAEEAALASLAQLRFPTEYPSPVHVASPYGVDMGYGVGVPVTPQFSPYATYNTAAAFSPAAPAWNPYSWATPYLSDPRYAHAAAASAYNQATFARRANELGTPTKQFNGKHDNLSEPAGSREH
ncbi:uncharacterized protein B0I36DRAFT_380683 [Microdochium trichocladiopsis]|uniref:RRM domain-containing protein n=1 Tax=Microdochium trichocladiopsis TaxID=1682393 RepID=A0A9P8YG88_9PEZI|nr:uncharacterized protein B0I36DRAFT_380683 [Microdochium trichocladiopsis]KAH7037500.1 hypothetical protein B0I36DRAFT_380683 [Microdochium trichocladiopsis]